MPWGEAAFAKARTEQKPIFLSIGYSTCHWCHVMAHESFEDAGVAEILNRDFVPVKVDREERPDVDRVYMAYVQHTTGHGGWPLSAWLTPGGRPFYGGTYFPKDDRPGRPGFISVLNAIARHWREQRDRIETGAAEVVEALRRHAAGGGAPEAGPEGEPMPLHEAAGEAFETCFRYFHESHDAQWGGFGGAPKFPRASVPGFLFRTAALQGGQTEMGREAVNLAAHTLQCMAEGGLHDHVGGGFHRYSVDEQWHVPHFEKMLHDQAQIALNCLEARQATGREVFAWLARDIFDYVRRDLTGPAGGFYSAEDADSPLPEAVGRVVPDGPQAKDGSSGGFALPKQAHAEGAFYVWTKAEIEGVLGPDAAFFCAHYDVKPAGNVAHDPQGEFAGKNILRQRRSLAVTAAEFQLALPAAEEKLLAGLEKLRRARERRPRPHRDDKIITAWNGFMISALAKGAQVLGDDDCFRAAGRAAEFIERELYDAATGVLYRCWREGRSDIPGFAEDYAALIQGLLDLYEAGFDVRWLRWAERLQVRMGELFWDAKGGGYFNSRADDPTVIMRLKEDYDGAEPAPNSVAAMNLLRLDWMVGDGNVGGVPSPRGNDASPGEGTRPTRMTCRDRALQTIESLRPQWRRAPHALPQLLCALELALAEPRTVVLAGDPAAADFRALTAVLHEKLGPRRALLCADGAEGQRWLAERKPYLAAMKPVDGRATAYVCENYTCQAPVTDPAALRRLPG
ncbi:MAG: thioredoxin domain-containing protein [Opitutae bacterium]|nr:thioredoxin domain-containing protein [Opitutae bacterium]